MSETGNNFDDGRLDSGPADAELADLLAAYEIPALSESARGEFVESTLLRIVLQQHDPAREAAQRTIAAGFADRVVAKLLEPPQTLETPQTLEPPQTLVDSAAQQQSQAALARAPETVELRSSLVPYLIAATLMIATAIALAWPKGPLPTMPRVQQLAASLDASIRSASDPVSAIASLVPVQAFLSVHKPGTTAAGTAARGSEADGLYEVPRLAAPSLLDLRMMEALDSESKPQVR